MGLRTVSHNERGRRGGPMRGGGLEAKILEVGADGERVAPSGKAGGRTVRGEVMGGEGEAGPLDGQKEQPNRHRDGQFRPHVIRLHGTPANAVVAAFRAMIGRMTPPGVVRADLVLRTVADLVRPAEERAGEEQAGQ